MSILIDTVLFDCWGTLIEAPNLMKQGATTKIFPTMLALEGYPVDYEVFREAYLLVSKRQNEIANVNWEEFDHEERLRDKYPELAEEWHPTWNGDWTPAQFPPGSNKKVWWKCSRGHEWEAGVKDRTRGTGCPYCYRERRQRRN